jgi:hypothetical protein
LPVAKPKQVRPHLLAPDSVDQPVESDPANLQKSKHPEKSSRHLNVCVRLCRLETKMARRILGLAHVEDMGSIKDPDRRAPCERRALKLAHQFMSSRGSITSVDGARQLAETLLGG